MTKCRNWWQTQFYSMETKLPFGEMLVPDPRYEPLLLCLWARHLNPKCSPSRGAALQLILCLSLCLWLSVCLGVLGGKEEDNCPFDSIYDYIAILHFLWMKAILIKYLPFSGLGLLSPTASRMLVSCPILWNPKSSTIRMLATPCMTIRKYFLYTEAYSTSLSSCPVICTHHTIQRILAYRSIVLGSHFWWGSLSILLTFEEGVFVSVATGEWNKQWSITCSYNLSWGLVTGGRRLCVPTGIPPQDHSPGRWWGFLGSGVQEGRLRSVCHLSTSSILFQITESVAFLYLKKNIYQHEKSIMKNLAMC